MIPIVRNIGNNQLYKYLGNDVFENIVTGKSGTVGEDKASSVFRFNVEATLICDEFPEVLNLIKNVGLKVDVSELLNMP